MTADHATYEELSDDELLLCAWWTVLELMRSGVPEVDTAWRRAVEGALAMHDLEIDLAGGHLAHQAVEQLPVFGVERVAQLDL